ncbi:hypothetical protein KKA50_03260 [Patescibacteria group bacterium]|nr:hypothetical protein [Patescibacteria group bacterium]
MDYNVEIENVKQELMSLGFTDDKLNQLLDLAAQEAIATAMDDLKEADDQTLDELEQNIQTEPTNDEDAVKQLNMVFQKAYGDNYENKKLELMYQYLKQTVEETRAAKDLYTRYQAGDPTAVATVKAQEGNPEAQKIMDMA